MRLTTNYTQLLMFLYLSKLLPLFLYPLGLACVLLLLALVLLWRRSKWTAIPIVLSLVLLMAGGNSLLCEWLVRSLEYQNLPLATIPTADAIVILGGCTKPVLPPRQWVEVSEEGDRVLYGAKLYRDGKAPRIILSGGRVDWSGGSRRSEAEDMTQLIEAMGVPKAAILQDPTSLNTYENAVNVKQIMKTQGIRRILLVTSALHMPRSLLIFKHLGIDAIAAPTDFNTTDSDWRGLPNSAAIVLNSLPDADRLHQTTRALKEYLGLLVYRLKGWL